MLFIHAAYVGVDKLFLAQCIWTSPVVHILLLILFFSGNGCTTKEKKVEDCYYSKPRSCQEYLEAEVKRRGSILAQDGIVVFKDWIFYLTYFDNVNQKIKNEYSNYKY